jgi:cytochrome c biogenesis protein CcdA
LYPGYLAYLAVSGNGNMRHLGLMVLAGVLTMMLVFGALIAVITDALAEWSAILLQPLGAAIMLLMGSLLLSDVNPFAHMSAVAPRAGRGQYAQAFLYGLLFAPMIMPCAGPLVVSIFSLSIGIAGLVEQLLFFLIFGLGFGLPLLALSFLPKELSERPLRRLTRHSNLISRLSGFAIIAFGVWNLRASWELLSLLV